MPWAAAYVVEVSTDPTFQSVFYSGYSETTTHKVGRILAESTQYHWRVRARNACGFGAFATSASFTTKNVRDVLLVDDDWDLLGDYQADYKAAMDALPPSSARLSTLYSDWIWRRWVAMVIAFRDATWVSHRRR